MEDNTDHRGRDNPAPKPLMDVPCRIRTPFHQIEWPCAWPMPKACGKIRALYISLFIKSRATFWKVHFGTLVEQTSLPKAKPVLSCRQKEIKHSCTESYIKIHRNVRSSTQWRNYNDVTSLTRKICKMYYDSVASLTDMALKNHHIS